MNTDQARRFVNETWDSSIVPTLMEYVKIPNKSPSFDRIGRRTGTWTAPPRSPSAGVALRICPACRSRSCGCAGRTPLLFIEVPGDVDDTVLLYGHLDKQPEFTGWAEGLGPWTPVIRDGRLYGRGGADDGYAVFSSLTAIRALRMQGIPHARCVVVIEFCEESGSFDLPHYIEALGNRIGTPTLVVCLDAECGNYDQLWCTTTLRGNLVGNLSIDVLTEGVHSGAASGIVPSSFRILRMLLSRVEDEGTGKLPPPAFQADIPAQRRQQAAAAATTLGRTIYEKFPWIPGMRPVSDDVTQLLLDNTWGSTLCVTGADGIPALGSAGNVLRPNTTVKLSFRLPPTTNAERAAREVKALLEADPPYAARGALRRAIGHVRLERARGQPVAGAGDACARRAPTSARMRCTWAPAAAFRSWGCSARNSRECSSSSPACSDRNPTRTVPTSSWISPPARS